MIQPQAYGRPARDEYADFYETYISKVPDGDIRSMLAHQVEETCAALQGVAPADSEFRYAAGKWSMKEVLRHMLDTEWVFAYRALTIARGDATPLPGMDQDVFAQHADVSGCRLTDLLDELLHLRKATVHLLVGLAEEAWDRRGVASGNPFTVRALAWTIAGHERHHLAVLRERYLGGAS